MDEIVFLRETFRRELVKVVELLDKAAEEYDPEADAPVADVVALTSLMLSPAQEQFADALTHRMDLRMAAKGD